MPEKPPYCLPTQAGIVRGPLNGFRAVSTFSGCGGSCSGLRMAGFKVVWASEFVDSAADTYHANYPETPLDRRDIREVAVGDVLAATGLEVGQLDLLEGSPPCASFSTCGKRAKGWGKEKAYSETKQRTDDLFLEFARLLEGLQPRAFVAENVSGLVKGVAKGYFAIIHERLRACGYAVKASVLDASLLGVPQARKRLFFVGFRNDLGAEPAFPSPMPWRYSISEALAGVVNSEADLAAVQIGDLAIGREWRKLAPGEKSRRYLNLVRPRADEPCPTITQTVSVRGAAGVTHPSECRKFTVPELRRLSGFPEDFILIGTTQQQVERIGRAVPPPMMAAVARRIAEVLRGRA